MIMEINDDLKRAIRGEPNNPIEEKIEGLGVRVAKVLKKIKGEYDELFTKVYCPGVGRRCTGRR